LQSFDGLPKRLFPAHAGMNRERIRPQVLEMSVPRARGDEPDFLGPVYRAIFLFPAHAGMNRCWQDQHRQ